MNSIKNAIVTITLLVVGYGSYVILREPTPAQFVDSRQPQSSVAASSSSDVDISVPDIQLSELSPADLAAAPIASPVGSRFEQPRWSNGTGTTQSRSADLQTLQPNLPGARPNVANNLASNFTAAKDAAAQQLEKTSEALSNRFQQARTFADDTAKSIETSTNQLGNQVQTFGNDVAARAKEFGAAAKEKLDTSLPPLPALAQDPNAAKIPELKTKLTTTAPAEATPEQVQFELPKSRFGGLQAKDAVPQKTSIEPPVAALAEPNSSIKPPFADKMQSENPFRKSVQVDDSKDKFPHMPRVDEWEPYEGAPLSAEQLAQQNAAAGNPTFTNNSSASLAAQPSSNAPSQAQPAEQSTSITVVEPGIVLPADATPMIANEGVTGGEVPNQGLASGNQGAKPFEPATEPTDTESTATAESYNPPVANRFQAPEKPNPVRPELTSSVTTLEPGSSTTAPGNSFANSSTSNGINSVPFATPANTTSSQNRFENQAATATPQAAAVAPQQTNATTTAPQTQFAGSNDLRPAAPVQPTEPKQPSGAFENVWKDVQALLKKREYSQALRTLTPWGSESDLSKEQLSRCVRLLDQLAGAIIYSRESYLEPAYTVQAGETLDEIAKQYGVPQQLIAKINGIAPPFALTNGEKLKVVRGPFRAAISLSRAELTLFVGAYYAGRFPIMVGPDLPPEPAFYEVADKSAGRAYFDRKLGREVNQSEESNRYGKHWLGLRGEHITSGHSVGIHGRSAKFSPADLGSINLAADDAEDVFSILSVGSRIQVLP